MGTRVCVGGWRAPRRLDSVASRLWNMDRVRGRSPARRTPRNQSEATLTACASATISIGGTGACLFQSPAQPPQSQLLSSCGACLLRSAIATLFWPLRRSCTSPACIRRRGFLDWLRRTRVEGVARRAAVHSWLRRAHALASPFRRLAVLCLPRPFRGAGLGQLLRNRELGIAMASKPACLLRTFVLGIACLAASGAFRLHRPARICSRLLCRGKRAAVCRCSIARETGSLPSPCALLPTSSC